MKKPFSAIFLDNDGVLVDTEKFYAEACDEISRDFFGIPFPLSMYQKYGYIKGTGISEYLKDKGIDCKEIKKFQAARDIRYEEKLSQDIIPMSGVKDFLKIKSREKIPMACVTAAPLRHFLQIHNQTGFLSFFDFWITNEDVKITKPSPECYIMAAEKMNIPAKECLVIEDSPRGIKAAKNAGMTVYAVPTEQTKELDLSLADKIFPGFPELILFLEK